MVGIVSTLLGLASAVVCGWAGITGHYPHDGFTLGLIGGIGGLVFGVLGVFAGFLSTKARRSQSA